MRSARGDTASARCPRRISRSRPPQPGLGLGGQTRGDIPPPSPAEPSPPLSQATDLIPSNCALHPAKTLARFKDSRLKPAVMHLPSPARHPHHSASSFFPFRLFRHHHWSYLSTPTCIFFLFILPFCGDFRETGGDPSCPTETSDASADKPLFPPHTRTRLFAWRLRSGVALLGSIVGRAYQRALSLSGTRGPVSSSVERHVLALTAIH